MNYPTLLNNTKAANIESLFRAPLGIISGQTSDGYFDINYSEQRT